MVHCDTIVENDSIFLENLCTTASTSWVTATTSTYMIYNIPYSKALIKDHIYYFRCKYKYTTTNQKPTWCSIYIQGGMNGTSATINNPQPNTEYTLSGYGYMTTGNSYTLGAGNIYNGSSGAINGVTAQIKDMVVYDVTHLYQALLASGAISDINTLITWCNTNLEWKAAGVRYDVTITDSTKVVMKNGDVLCTPVECDGMEWYSIGEVLRKNTYFDGGSGIYVYNNNGNGTVTFERVSAKDQNSPFYPEHPYVLKIKTNGSASPYCGGFYTNHSAGANKVFIERFVAKIPVGYYLTAHYNSQGTGATVTWITPTAGTGKWEEYAVLYKCGSSGTFSTGGHVALAANTGYSSTSVTWYVAYVNDCDITSDSSLAYYTALNSKNSIKGTKLYSQYFNTVNLFPNGDGSTTTMPLSEGWTWDTDDVPTGSKAKASITQPVGANASYDIGGKLAVNPHKRYKLSMWIKCKKDMSNFLVAICPYTGSLLPLNHGNVVYVPGTKTTLTANLTNGATQMSVSSNANWIDRSYSKVGFRENIYKDSWNTKGSSNSNSQTGLIKGVSGSNIVTFKIPYSGSTIPSGTVVVESYDGGTWPYPIGKDNLPTDNNWKYVEGYFGSEDAQWDGSSNAGWLALPSDTTHITLALNIYGNNGSVPIKYADIKIEEIGTTDGERHLNTIQFKKFD